jgi:hypothetical protein
MPLPQEDAMVTPSESRYDVLSPSGRRAAVPEAALAPRLPDLSGRTVAFVWDHVFHGDSMFERFQAELSRRATGVRFVGHEEFGNIHGMASEEHEAVERLPMRLTAEDVDAVVVGVGA